MLPKLNADQIPGMHLPGRLSASAPDSEERPASAGDRLWGLCGPVPGLT